MRLAGLARRVRLAALVWAALSAPVLACEVPQGADAFADTVVSLANDLRAERRRPGVRLDARLAQAAQAHACHMAATGALSHTGAGGSDVGDRITATGYRWRMAAENIAQGQMFPGDVVASWAGSRGHRKNLLDRRATDVGVAVAYRGNTPFWVMVLAARR